MEATPRKVYKLVGQEGSEITSGLFCLHDVGLTGASKKTMRVRVLYFGVLKDLFGREREDLDLAEGDLAGTLIRRVAERGEAGAGLAKALAVAVNREYACASAVLRDGDEVALLPPVSGGADAR